MNPVLLIREGRRPDWEAAEAMGLDPVVPDRSDVGAALLRDREVYVWPGDDGMWDYAAGSVAHARILDPYRLRRFSGIFQFRQAVGDGAAMVLGMAMKESVSLFTRLPETRYVGLAGAPLAELGEKLAAPIEAIPTWSPMWNRACGMFGGRKGLPRESYTIIGGASGLGKTYVATNLAGHAMLDESLTPEQRSPAFHSLEMSWESLGLRMLARVAGEPIYRLEPGEMHDREAFRRAAREMDRLRTMGVQIRMPKKPISKLSELVDSIRYEYEVHGSTLHIVDYVQLAWIDDADSMQKQIIECSHALRKLFLDLRLVGVALSQLTREATTNRQERPRKENLLGGSALENDSVMTILLDHTRVIRSAGHGWTGWLNLDKNRNGDMVDIPIEFVSRTLTMRERMDDEVSAKELEAPTSTGRRKR